MIHQVFAKLWIFENRPMLWDRDFLRFRDFFVTSSFDRFCPKVNELVLWRVPVHRKNLVMISQKLRPVSCEQTNRQMKALYRATLAKINWRWSSMVSNGIWPWSTMVFDHDRPWSSDDVFWQWCHLRKHDRPWFMTMLVDGRPWKTMVHKW